MTIIIKKGRLIDPATGKDGLFDILVENGKVTKIEKSLNQNADVAIDASDKIVAPGLIDMHVHLREPGFEDKETISTALRAAARGGFSSVCAMPNTIPPCDNQSVAWYVQNEAKKWGLGNVFPVGTISKNRQGKELSEMGDLKVAGCVAFSDDGNSIEDTSLMRRALEYAGMLGLPILSHCEDRSLSYDGVMHEGFISTILGLQGIPAGSESIIVERDIELAEIAGSMIHIQHVSTAESVKNIQSAKKRNVKVTSEVTPHHIFLTDESVKTFDTNTKVNPPLRTAEDKEVLKKALKSGIIDVIATDHAPHLESEKDVEFNYAPFGMIGLETALSICIQELIDAKVLTWIQLIEKMSLNPSKILGLGRGTIQEGAIADITVIDPHHTWTYKREEIYSKSANSPFIGLKMKGCASDVIVNGKIVLKDRNVLPSG